MVAEPIQKRRCELLAAEDPPTRGVGRCDTVRVEEAGGGRSERVSAVCGADEKMGELTECIERPTTSVHSAPKPWRVRGMPFSHVLANVARSEVVANPPGLWYLREECLGQWSPGRLKGSIARHAPAQERTEKT